jgi:4-hydroxy-3-methylbut-2-en-1-yl diphosphate synthase IspG/GcpE
MLSNRLVRWIVVMVCVLSAYGCAKKSNSPAAQQEPTKTAAQYKAEADKQINEQNASQELAKLEQEVAAEEANQP